MFKCHKCQLKIQKQDELFAKGRKWHARCWSCDTCGTQLSYSFCHELNGRMFCNNCSLDVFGPNNAGSFMIKWNREHLSGTIAKRSQNDPVFELQPLESGNRNLNNS